MNEQNNQNIYGPQEEKVKANLGWIIFGIVFPWIALILFFVWRKSKKSEAKGAIIGFLISLVLIILYFALILQLMKKKGYNNYCNVYGSTFEYLKEGNNYYCIDMKTGEKILIKGENMGNYEATFNFEDNTKLTIKDYKSY